MTPILFLFYITNLAKSLFDEAVIVTFANDVSILTAAKKKKTNNERAIQTEVDKVLQWNKSWKLQLNAGKSEDFTFFTWSNDS